MKQTREDILREYASYCTKQSKYYYSYEERQLKFK